LSKLRWALSLSRYKSVGNNLVAKLWIGYIPHEPHLTYMGPRDSLTQVLVRKVFAWAFRIRTSWSHGFQKTIWNKHEIVPCWGPLAWPPQDQVFARWANRFLAYFHHWPIWMIKFLKTHEICMHIRKWPQKIPCSSWHLYWVFFPTNLLHSCLT
jgi:hypothetical protein